MPSKRKRARRMKVWRRYQNRIDRLAPTAPHPAAYTGGCLFVIRTNPGFFRAEGWNTDDARSYLRHGA